MLTLVHQSLEHLFGVAVAQLRPRVATRGALCEDLDRSIEPDRDRALVQEFFGGRIDVCAAAGGDHANIALDEAGDQAALTVTEVAFAIALEHFSGGITGC